MTQNVGGIAVGQGRVAGNSIKLVPLKLKMQKSRAHIVVLTETRHVNIDKYSKFFKKYRVTQSASSGERRGGVIVLAREDVEFLDIGIESRDGHYTVGVYNIQGVKIVIGGVYGISSSSEVDSYVLIVMF